MEVNKFSKVITRKTPCIDASITVVKEVARLDVEGEKRRRKGGPMWRWMDSVNVGMREKTQHRAMWKSPVRQIDPK